MRLGFVGASLLLVVFISSCQKEIDWGADNRTDADSLYIDKLIELDTSFAGGSDTSFKYSFQYDGQKRLTQIAETGFDAGTSTILYTSNEYRQYAGTDTGPFKITRKEVYSNGQTFDDTVYFFYNSNSIIKDSMIRYSSGIAASQSRTVYTSTGNGKFMVKRTDYDPSSGIVFNVDSINSSRTIVGNNVTSSSDSVYGQLAGGLYDVYRYTYNYDDKINPFKKMSLPYPLYIDLLNTYSYEYIASPVSTNNPVSYTLMHWFAGNTFNQPGQLKYTYNSAGYPTIIRFADPSAPDTRKQLITYRPL
jgi:hypothetical protein